MIKILEDAARLFVILLAVYCTNVFGFADIAGTGLYALSTLIISSVLSAALIGIASRYTDPWLLRLNERLFGRRRQDAD
ncbi:hypothetical protein AWN76_012595 [Rhodothermaceae bacterium RA]|nr:hypothetical protein AWN76_012595 [Rhodothermaceae bacterium RA]